MSDFIATLALIVSSCSAFYTFRQKRVAENNNRIAVSALMRPFQVELLYIMQDFTDYCSGYWTLYCHDDVDGSTELYSHIRTFKHDIRRYAHLGMPDIQEKADVFIDRAYKLAVLIDRIESKQNNPYDKNYTTAKENIQGLVDRFNEESSQLNSLFQNYLNVENLLDNT